MQKHGIFKGTVSDAVEVAEEGIAPPVRYGLPLLRKTIYTFSEDWRLYFQRFFVELMNICLQRSNHPQSKISSET